MTKRTPIHWQDGLAAALVIAYAAAIVVRPLPNFDLWWLLAVGRRIVETHRYIYSDPFSFTLAGAPWSPQSYASGVIMFLLHKAGGMAALTMLRVVLVGATVALLFRSLRSIGAAWAVAAPLVMVAVITSHSRLTDRGQLFEYGFIAWLTGFLLTSHTRRGKSFFVIPVVVQLAWVQLHSSFLLGPALAAIFFGSEWVGSFRPGLGLGARHDFRRAALLVLLLVLACVVNPNPRAFLIQPFDPAQRALLAEQTTEWQSPFSAPIAAANFHPYYEILLAAALVAVLANGRRTPLAPAALLVATAFLSLQAHRFRVEFALVAVPMIALLAVRSPLVKRLARSPRSRRVAIAVGLAAVLGIALVERERALATHDDPGLYPDGALAFVARNDVARRPFHSIGFGSYMMWNLYGVRQTFIDGRTFDPGLYREFVDAQSSVRGWREVIDKYHLDAFILPSPSQSDGAMQNVHRALIEARDEWDLVYLDGHAGVYVARAAVDSTWLAAHALRSYHPLTFAAGPGTPEEMARTLADLERVVATEPVSTQALGDLGVLYLLQGRFQEAIPVFERFAALEPDNALVHVNLARAWAGTNDIDAALRACDRALQIDPGNVQAGRLREALLRVLRK